jgi:8-oxo-dGTP pyrophosphatase MutT (NUDIX family)
VSFPGGHIDGDDETPIDAALREMEEELGIDTRKLRALGVCQTIPAITGTLVTPVVGYVDYDLMDMHTLSPQEAEVDGVFTRTLEELCEGTYRRTEVLERCV